MIQILHSVDTFDTFKMWLINVKIFDFFFFIILLLTKIANNQSIATINTKQIEYEYFSF